MIRCLIVDDEPIAIRVVASHLENVPDARIVATCTNAVDALRVLRSQSVDLVFLDIEMPEVTGLEFVDALASPPGIIFTTAHREHAARGFELDAVDYLLKPIGFPRLNRAIEKYRRLHESEHRGDMSAPEDAASINIHIDRRTVRLDLRDILYVESLSDYVIIHTKTSKLTTKLRIGDLEGELAPHGFLRIHRSYVVPLRRVDSFTAVNVRVGGETLPISRTYRQRVLERLRTGGHG